jgi:hypothetical protein
MQQRQRNAFHPLPAVNITTPTGGTNLKRTTSGGTGTVAVNWTQAWTKPDGKPYSNLFTFSTGGTPAPYSTAYFLKYRYLGPGGAWKMVGTNTVTDGGILPPDLTVDIPVVKAPTASTGSVNWNYDSLPAGDYLLRLEGYRDIDTSTTPDTLSTANYAFHQIHVAVY